MSEVYFYLEAGHGDGKDVWDSDSGASFQMYHTQAGMTAYKKAPAGTAIEVIDAAILPVNGIRIDEVDMN